VAIILTLSGRITSESTTAEAAEKTDPTTTTARCWVCQHVQVVPRSQAAFVCEQCGAKLERRTQPATGNTTTLPSPGLRGTAPQSTISAPNPPQKCTKAKGFKCEHLQVMPLSEATLECAESGAKLKGRTQTGSGQHNSFFRRSCDRAKVV
jgi:hypothetical protein